MPQSLSFVLVHLIFSTKNRLPLLHEDVRGALYAYLATVIRTAECECFRAGGMPDHVHLAVRLTRTMSVAELVEQVKSSSSKWLKTQSPASAEFAWQRGYAAFSVGPADLGALIAYIDGQEAHHIKVTFQDEFRAFLKKYGVQCDERYMWN